MPKTSVIIPARNEPHLQRTVEDILAKAAGSIQVVVVLEEYWPPNWPEVVRRSQGRIITVHNSVRMGMRGAINAGVDCSDDCEFIIKSDAHCMFAPGFDDALTANCGKHQVIVPRRFRLDAENWKVIEDGRPPVDYEYLTFPGTDGGGLKGKAWEERAKERAGFTRDDTPLSQGSCWCMRRSYFEFLELMDEETYGDFWKEMLEIGLKVWLSGGRIIVQKDVWYAHWHKKTRGYSLDKGSNEQALAGVRPWLTGNAWHKQTRAFSSFIKKFSMPTWAPGWESRL